MPKYRGKYKKCRTCAHVEEVLMVLVRVNPDCPHGKTYGDQNKDGYAMSDKFTCEKCKAWKPKEANDGK